MKAMGDHTLLLVSTDCFFLGGDSLPDDTFAQPVPSQGNNYNSGAKAFAAAINLCGHLIVKLRSNQEPAIADVKKCVESMPSP